MKNNNLGLTHVEIVSKLPVNWAWNKEKKR